MVDVVARERNDSEEVIYSFDSYILAAEFCLILIDSGYFSATVRKDSEELGSDADLD